MNILFIPSWWPTKSSPSAGIFFKEQIERLAELYPQHQFVVLYWGSPHLELKPGHIWQTIKNFFSFDTLPLKPKSLTNLRFISTPLITLPRKLFGVPHQAWALEKRIRHRVPDIKFDLIHAMVGHPAGIIARSFAHKWKIPYLITEVMGPFPFPHLREADGTIWPPLLEAYRDAAVTISDGQAKLKQMQAEGIGKTRYLPNFINEDFFQIVPTVPYTKFRFFTLSGFVEGKGLDVLLRAIAALSRREEFQFVIGGAGPLGGSLKEMARDLKIDHLIEWKGHLDRKQALKEFQSSDAFVLPSRFESFGIVYVESLFCGKPIVATRCGGPEEFVNETTGLLCDVDSGGQIAAAMALLKANSSQYDAQRIRDWAFERYSSKKVCGQLIECYLDLKVQS